LKSATASTGQAVMPPFDVRLLIRGAACPRGRHSGALHRTHFTPSIRPLRSLQYRQMRRRSAADGQCRPASVAATRTRLKAPWWRAYTMLRTAPDAYYALFLMHSAFKAQHHDRVSHKAYFRSLGQGRPRSRSDIYSPRLSARSVSASLPIAISGMTDDLAESTCRDVAWIRARPWPQVCRGGRRFAPFAFLTGRAATLARHTDYRQDNLRADVQLIHLRYMKLIRRIYIRMPFISVWQMIYYSDRQPRRPGYPLEDSWRGIPAKATYHPGGRDLVR